MCEESDISRTEHSQVDVEREAKIKRRERERKKRSERVEKHSSGSRNH